ncbi:universal stress protein [Halostagnicola sp. A-GB9-2]|uniref:universal stress protein n=1 Tax=Halostagnicola sp. A-GB9-2 TaxID=3048066 RepID=UPI0024C0BD32|nr:universal stress protein [Halostagnicola sp. A-GB9-2]MDJ1430885.1 universal stress protein [Halostagnicola sp. A-GB9-2]
MPTNRLLVPVANPETADRLLTTAVDIARDRDLEILVLNVVDVPMQLTLEQAQDELDVESHEEIVQYAVDIVREADVPVMGRVRFGRDVAGGVIDVAESQGVDAVLLGWRGRPRRRDVVLGSYIDEVLANAPCDVYVKRIDRDQASVDSILVPVAGGPNTTDAATVAGTLARANDASVELVHVVADRTEETVEAGRELLTRTSSELGAVESVSETVLEGPVVETITERADDHDLIVIGAAESGVLRRVLVGNVPEEIGREADSAVIMVKRRQGVPETLWRRIRDRLV